MELMLYNTLSGKKECFVPLREGRAGIYVCGITPYDEPHMGHARAYVVFDTIRRYLQYLGLRTTYVQNYTDIDDKIIRKAEQLNISPAEVAARYIASYEDAASRLNILPPDITPRATEHIKEMVQFVVELVAKGIAYEADGDVYFSIEKFSRYGKLSGKRIDQLMAGARVDVNERKRHPGDFALWKKAGEKEISWESPWGRGRPGWHLECSVMSRRYLGQPFDIHGGGMDLIFPHHENEIAQSESLYGTELARYFLHNGFVTLNEQKMSKSLGNFFTVNEVLKHYEPMVLRLFLLSVHYRSPIDFSDNMLETASRSLEQLQGLRFAFLTAPESKDCGGRQEEAVVGKVRKEFEAMMNDDCNTAGALGVLFKHSASARQCIRTAWPLYEKLIRDVLGIRDRYLESDTITAYGPGSAHYSEEVVRLFRQRALARKDGDFSKSDTLRERLINSGFTVEDRPGGSIAYRKNDDGTWSRLTEKE